MAKTIKQIADETYEKVYGKATDPLTIQLQTALFNNFKAFYVEFAHAVATEVAAAAKETEGYNPAKSDYQKGHEAGIQAVAKHLENNFKLEL